MCKEIKEVARDCQSSVMIESNIDPKYFLMLFSRYLQIYTEDDIQQIHEKSVKALGAKIK